MNHPAGRIGKRLILRVHDVMLTGSALPLAAPNTLIMEVTTHLLSPLSHEAGHFQDLNASATCNICLP